MRPNMPEIPVRQPRPLPPHIEAMREGLLADAQEQGLEIDVDAVLQGVLDAHEPPARMARDFPNEVTLPIDAPPLDADLQDLAAQDWDEGDYVGWLTKFRREVRMEAVAACVGLLPRDEISRMFMDAWTDGDHHLWKQQGLIQSMFRAVDPMAAMSPEEREWLDSLPDPITAYRACHEANAMGLSWTTSRETADRFVGYRPPSNATMFVLRCEVPKSAVFMACLDRNESEIVVRDPESLPTPQRLG